MVIKETEVISRQTKVFEVLTHEQNNHQNFSNLIKGLVARFTFDI